MVFTHPSPGRALSETRHVERDLGLRAGARQVQRPRTERATGLHQLRDRDVQHALAAGLAAGDAREQALDQGSALARRPRELVTIYGVYRVDACLLLSVRFGTEGRVISACLSRFAIA